MASSTNWERVVSIVIADIEAILRWELLARRDMHNGTTDKDTIIHFFQELRVHLGNTDGNHTEAIALINRVISRVISFVPRSRNTAATRRQDAPDQAVPHYVPTQTQEIIMEVNNTLCGIDANTQNPPKTAGSNYQFMGQVDTLQFVIDEGEMLEFLKLRELYRKQDKDKEQEQ